MNKPLLQKAVSSNNGLDMFWMILPAVIPSALLLMPAQLSVLLLIRLRIIEFNLFSAPISRTDMAGINFNLIEPH